MVDHQPARGLSASPGRGGGGDSLALFPFALKSVTPRLSYANRGTKLEARRFAESWVRDH